MESQRVEHLVLPAIYRYADYWSPPFVFDNCGVPIPWGPLSGVAATIMFRDSPEDQSPIITISTTSSAAGAIYLGPVAVSPPGSNESYLLPGGLQFFTSKASNLLLASAQARLDCVVTWANGTEAVIFTAEADVLMGYTR